MTARSALVLWFIGLLLALVAAAPAAAIPRTIAWASPPGAGGPFTEIEGPTTPDNVGRGDVCGARREGTNLLNGNILTAATPDGSKVFFTTRDKLTADDTDSGARDIYEFSGGQTKLISHPGGLAFDSEYAYLIGCSTDGSKVFFTIDRGVNYLELYERSAGTTKQVNFREAGGTGSEWPAIDAAISADGDTVAFSTNEHLTSDDTDGAAEPDVFVRKADDTILVSDGAEAVNQGSTTAAISADGTNVYFHGRVPLSVDDLNTHNDVYRSVNTGAPELLSIDPGTGKAAGGDVIYGSSFLRASPDNGLVYIWSTAPIDGDDADTDLDIYVRNVGAATTEWMTKPDTGQPQGSFPQFVAASDDGARLFFSSDAALTADDTDTSADLFLRTPSALTLISKQVAGSGQNVQGGCDERSTIRSCVSSDATKIFFATQERLTAGDTDENSDVYRWTAPAGPIELASGAVAGSEHQVGGVSSNGNRMLFQSDDRLSCLDTDNNTDVYEWEQGGATTLVSTPIVSELEGSVLDTMSADGSAVFFQSNAAYGGSGGDGQLIDLFAARPGGSTPVCPSTVPKVPQCSDGKDNDSDGAVDTADPGCLNGTDDNEGDDSLRDLVLCGRRDISLVRADQRGTKVVLSGLVSKKLAGKQVVLSVSYGAQPTTLAKVKPKADGQFTATVKGPKRRLLARARYRAAVGRTRSVSLKLPQALASTSIKLKGGTVELRGKVTKSLLGKKRNKVVVRRLVCGKLTTTASARPGKSGAYVVRFKAPPLAAAALYRVEGRVLARPGSKRYVKQFARAIGIALSGQSG